MRHAVGEAAEFVPVADFFRSPMITSPVMSPNGKHVAAAIAGGPQGRRRLVVLNVADWSQPKLLAAFADADVQTVHWVNDNRVERFLDRHLMKNPP